MSTEMRRILTIGVKLASVVNPGNIVTEQKEEARSKNFELDIHTIDTTEPIGDILRDLDVYLNVKKYLAVGIGFGVRGNPELTALFETLVNRTIEKQPQAKLGFPQTPNDMVKSCERALNL